MSKVKMYCAETMGTFRMMFGFAQPLKYIKNKRDIPFSNDYAKLKNKKKYDERK